MTTNFSFDIDSVEKGKISSLENLLNSFGVKFKTNEKIKDDIPHKFGVKIIMDEDKIKRDKIYTLDEVYSAIDKIAKKSKMTKIDKFHYIPTNGDPSFCGVFTYCYLQHQEWFVKNVKEWIWIDKEEEEGNEDILQCLKEENSYATIS